MRRCVRLTFALLVLPVAVALPGFARATDNPCTPERCPGLISFENVDALVADLATERNAARLAYELGLTLVRQGCCFAEAVAYLRYAR